MIWKVSASLAALAAPAEAASCQDVIYDRNRYTVCSADLTQNTARLFWRDADGAIYGHFAQLPDDVLIATNGCMYHEDRRPVGHYLEEDQEVVAPIASAGPGNFGLLPNGVLCLNDGAAQILETRAYIDARPDCAYATQSGPLLVLNGELHPRFIEGSDSRKRRGGVGVSADGRTLFIVVTVNAVNFYDFGTLFRDGLGTPYALFLDGTVTRLFDRAGDRSDGGTRMGPILAIIE